MLEFNEKVNPVVTSINKKNFMEFKKQIQRMENDQPIIWEDTYKEKTLEIGGLFCFTHFGDSVEICKITGFIKKDDSIWYQNKNNKNLLMISPIIVTISWNEWLSIGGHKKICGTTIIKKNKKIFIDGIKKYLIQISNKTEIRHKIEVEGEQYMYKYGIYNSNNDSIRIYGKKKDLRFKEFANFHYSRLKKNFPDLNIISFSENDFEIMTLRRNSIEIWKSIN